MSAGMEPRSQSLPKLPGWDLSASHAELYEQLGQTKVMLETYEMYLSDLMTEYGKKPSRRKARAVETAAGDVRAAHSQFVAISSCFLQKNKDVDRRKEIKEAMSAAQKDHGSLQAGVDEVLEKEQEEERPEERARGEVHSRPQVKPVKELEPSLVAQFKMSGTELERWSNEMTIWATASGFQRCVAEVQTAFAFKFLDPEMAEKVKEVAELEGITLDFKTVVERVKALCQSQSYLFIRRVDFFLMKSRDTTAKGYIDYMHKLLKEHKAAEIDSMASDAKTYSVYKVISELPAVLRNRVVQTMEREMSFEELRAELEKVASLQTMEEAVDKKPKVTKVVEGQGANQREGEGEVTPRRGRWPEGFHPSMFGCLRCGERTNPPHEARSCPTPKADLECSFCGMKGSHVEAVCFKRLEAGGKSESEGPQQQERSQSPGGGRPASPYPRSKKLQVTAFGGVRTVAYSNIKLNKLRVADAGGARQVVGGVFWGQHPAALGAGEVTERQKTVALVEGVLEAGADVEFERQKSVALVGGVLEAGADVEFGGQESVALVEGVPLVEEVGREVGEKDEKGRWGGYRPGNGRVFDQGHSFQTSGLHSEGSGGLFGVRQQQQHEWCVVSSVAAPAQRLQEQQQQQRQQQQEWWVVSSVATPAQQLQEVRHQRHDGLQRGLGWEPQGVEEQVGTELRKAGLGVEEGGEVGRSAPG